MAAIPSTQASSARSTRARLDRAVEVVREREHLADQVLAGEPEVALALLRRAASEVGELGSLALQRGQVLVDPGRQLITLGA